MTKKEELKAKQGVLNKAKFYKDNSMYLLSGFCMDCYKNGNLSGWDADKMLINLKANYDYSPMDYLDLIKELANLFGGFDAMQAKTYKRIIL